MIKEWFITGDTHGRVSARILDLKEQYPDLVPNETALIILGDAGINFFLNKTDRKNKAIINAFNIYVYCVRGNHEERPQNIGIDDEWDENVQGFVYSEPDFPFIKYFHDGDVYTINGKKCLVIGGAYSIDKEYRLSQAKPGASWTGWFPQEMLTKNERDMILEKIQYQHYDFVFTHTCPISMEPTDLFLDFIDQSKVDKTMENFLEEVRKSITFGIWCFGHYHADRVESERVEQFYYSIEPLNKVWNYWFGGEN